MFRLTFTVATPFELVLAVYVLPFTVKVTLIPGIGFPFADLKVALTCFVFALALYVLLAVVNLAFCFSTVINATSKVPL